MTDNKCLCIKCGKLTTSKSWCRECRNKYNKEYHKENRSEILDRKREYDRRRAKDPKRREQHNRISREYYKNHKAKVLKRNLEYLAKAKELVFNYYGNRCACCGEKHSEFLAIDHINGGGKKHREKIGRSGRHFYVWLVKNNFPKEFQTLCHNCNFAKSFYDKCPHQRN